jgi:site-specific DNA-methyltransferase (adenine-specific)
MNTGRWPANLIHDGSDEVIEAFPNAPGQQGDLKETGRDRPSSGRFGDMAPPVPHKARVDDSKSAARFFKECKETREGEASATRRYTENGATNFAALPGQRRFDTGSVARFFYTAKSNKKDRGEGNDHPTVKPNALMRYLVRLITPPGGVVLDPFCGSGSTGKAAVQEGFRFIGIDRDAHYIEIATRRIEEVANDNTRTDNEGCTDSTELATTSREAISGPDGYAGDRLPWE